MLTWEELESACLLCEKCPISKNRTNVVVGDGNKNAKLVFVGEAPGEEEDKQGKPFVGRAGKFLDLALTSLELSREKDFYICNILKCRPPNNRVPTEVEAQNCLPFLRAQIKLISPKNNCLSWCNSYEIYSWKKTLKITQDRGKWFEKGGFWIMATYHPAALLRDPGKREDFYRDLKSVKERLEKIK